MKTFIYLFGLILFCTVTSCEREIENNNNDANFDFSDFIGKWEVAAFHGDSMLIYGPFELVTLKKTPVGNDSINIMDSTGAFWKFQTKAHVDKNNGIFQTELSRCKVSKDAIGIKVSNGKILNTDSIYFEIQFEDDVTPYGNTYQIRGHRIN